MSVHLSIDSGFKAVMPAVNAGVNTLTDLISTLGRKYGFNEKATLHYDIKATGYNLTTALAVFKAAALVFGFGSLGSTAVAIGVLLFLREVINRSMSCQSTATSAVQGLVNGVAGFIQGKNSIQKEAVTADSVAAGYLTTFKTLMKLNNAEWKEDVKVGNYTVFKNWHATIPQMIAFLKSL